MTKIAFIGAGSLGFTRGLVRDILTFPLLKNSTICLMDIDPERLDFAQQVGASASSTMGNYPAKVEATTGPRRGAQGRRRGRWSPSWPAATEVWRHDIEIPKKYGVDINIGDTRGPSRHLPRPAHHPGDARHRQATWSATARTPSCSTTPTRWPCSAGRCSARRSIQVTGLCHSVQGTADDAGRLDRRAV